MFTLIKKPVLVLTAVFILWMPNIGMAQLRRSLPPRPLPGPVPNRLPPSSMTTAPFVSGAPPVTSFGTPFPMAGPFFSPFAANPFAGSFNPALNSASPAFFADPFVSSSLGLSPFGMAPFNPAFNQLQLRTWNSNFGRQFAINPYGAGFSGFGSYGSMFPYSNPSVSQASQNQGGIMASNPLNLAQATYGSSQGSQSRQRIAWPIGVRILVPEDLRSRIEFLAAQTANGFQGNAGQAMTRAIGEARQLVRTSQRDKFSLSLSIYEEAVSFLDQLEKGSIPSTTTGD